MSPHSGPPTDGNPARKPADIVLTDTKDTTCAVITFPEAGDQRAGAPPTVMIDCGSSLGTQETAEKMRATVRRALAGRKRIDHVFLTHPDSSHCNALLPVTQGLEIGQVSCGGDLRQYAGLQGGTELHRWLVGNNARTFPPSFRGLGAPVVSFAGMRLYVLAANSTGHTGSSDADANGCVLLLVHGSLRVAFLGDVPGSVAAGLQAEAFPAGAEDEHMGHPLSSQGQMLVLGHPSADGVYGWPWGPEGNHRYTLVREHTPSASEGGPATGHSSAAVLLSGPSAETASAAEAEEKDRFTFTSVDSRTAGPQPSPPPVLSG
ncbi:MBL fold metallo-hydrolase [Streptomyces sp. NPDC001678]|uniref:MBL fold metallo-hydrolase n=1 Tax=Streptomyces sp. NPDC001678 TaxID=3364599 RepID=UPI0036A85DB4